MYYGWLADQGSINFCSLTHNSPHQLLYYLGCLKISSLFVSDSTDIHTCHNLAPLPACQTFPHGQTHSNKKFYLDGLSSGIFPVNLLCFPLGIKTKSVLLFCSIRFPDEISPFIERTVRLYLHTIHFFPVLHYTYIIIFKLHSQR